ncbi:hypothetical protein [Salinibius halmophilus]|uniref:hypothetical protein n=1 Tax=Salinibius halmophilus TaxID=1853216 RepID=UPI000E660B00|nr:hypothetical protein [Salinibius halmophilus]
MKALGITLSVLAFVVVCFTFSALAMAIFVIGILLAYIDEQREEYEEALLPSDQRALLHCRASMARQKALASPWAPAV